MCNILPSSGWLRPLTHILGNFCVVAHNVYAEAAYELLQLFKLCKLINQYLFRFYAAQTAFINILFGTFAHQNLNNYFLRSSLSSSRV